MAAKRMAQVVRHLSREMNGVPPNIIDFITFLISNAKCLDKENKELLPVRVDSFLFKLPTPNALHLNLQYLYTQIRAPSGQRDVTVANSLFFSAENIYIYNIYIYIIYVYKIYVYIYICFPMFPVYIIIASNYICE